MSRVVIRDELHACLRQLLAKLRAFPLKLFVLVLSSSRHQYRQRAMILTELHTFALCWAAFNSCWWFISCAHHREALINRAPESDGNTTYQ